MLINPARNPSIFRRQFPIRLWYPSQHLRRQNPLARSQFGSRRRFPDPAAAEAALATHRQQLFSPIAAARANRSHCTYSSGGRLDQGSVPLRRDLRDLFLNSTSHEEQFAGLALPRKSRRRLFQIEMHLIDVTELPLNCGDIGKSWQPGFVAEVLDLVGGSSAGETEMLLPAF